MFLSTLLMNVSTRECRSLGWVPISACSKVIVPVNQLAYKLHRCRCEDNGFVVHVCVVTSECSNGDKQNGPSFGSAQEGGRQPFAVQDEVLNCGQVSQSTPQPDADPPVSQPQRVAFRLQEDQSLAITLLHQTTSNCQVRRRPSLYSQWRTQALGLGDRRRPNSQSPTCALNPNSALPITLNPLKFWVQRQLSSQPNSHCYDSLGLEVNALRGR